MVRNDAEIKDALIYFVDEHRIKEMQIRYPEYKDLKETVLSNCITQQS